LGQRPRFKADALNRKLWLSKIPDQAFWLVAYLDLANQLARRPTTHTLLSFSETSIPA